MLVASSFCALQAPEEEAQRLSLAASCQQLPEGIHAITAHEGTQGSCRLVPLENIMTGLYVHGVSPNSSSATTSRPPVLVKRVLP